MPWTVRAALPVIALGLGAIACSQEKTPKSKAPPVPTDPVQAEAEAISRELVDVLDRVVAYKSSHRDRIPTSLRQAGLDSLTPDYIRRIGRDGTLPKVTIVIRRPAGRHVASCAATSRVLEDRVLREGTYQLRCAMVGGEDRTFVIPPTPPAAPQ